MRGRRPCGLSRLRQTQENRKIVQRTVFRKKPSSGVSWAGPRPAEDFHKPACPARESVRRPLAQAGGKGKHGASATAPAATAFGVCAACAAFLPPAAPVKAVERCSTPRKLLKKFDQNFYAASRFGSASILPADCAGPAPAWPCPGSAPGSWGTPGSPWSPAPARSSDGRGSCAAGTAVLQNFPTGSRR